MFATEEPAQMFAAPGTHGDLPTVSRKPAMLTRRLAYGITARRLTETAKGKFKSSRIFAGMEVLSIRFGAFIFSCNQMTT